MHSSNPALTRVAALLRLGLYGGAFTVTALHAQTAPTTGTSTAAEPQVIEVTASKRKERLQDAPLTVNAITTATLEKLGIEKFDDYMSLIPNLSQNAGSSTGVGVAGSGTIILRGLNSGPAVGTNTSAVYLGETPFTANGAWSGAAAVTPDPDLVDVERVEVLKGPQGTLYGANAMGGLIRIIPLQPDFKVLSGRIRLGVNTIDGGKAGYGARASINVPLGESFALRAGVFNRKDGGYLKNTGTGHDGMGEVKATGGSVALRWKPINDLNINLRGLTQQSKTLGQFSQDNAFGSLTPKTGKYEYSAYYDAPSKVKYDLAEATADYSVAAGTLTATISKAKYRLDQSLDVTDGYGNFYGLLAQFGVLTLPAGPNLTRGEATYSMDKTSGEVRFASNRVGPFQYLLGAFSTKEDSTVNSQLIGESAYLKPYAAPLYNLLTTGNSSSFKETAVFGNLTYFITEEVDITGGLRYLHSKQSGVLGGPKDPILGVPGYLCFVADCSDKPVPLSEHKVLYQATGRWRPDRDTSLYIRAASGYRPGGSQNSNTLPPGTPPSFKADTVATYEAGVKGRAARTVNYDLAVYQIDWKDMQLTATFNNLPFIANAGKARIRGIEAQAGVNLNPVTLNASLGYNDAKLITVNDTSAVALGASNGDRLPNSPKLTASVLGDYEFAVIGDISGKVGASVKYQGSKPSSFPQDTASPKVNEPSYTTLDLRASLEWTKYTLRLGVDNVTNKAGLQSYITPTGAFLHSSATPIRPRTTSLTLSADF